MTTENTETTETTDTAAAVAEQGANVAPEKASSKKGASPKKAAPKSPKGAKGGKPKATAPKKATPAKQAAKAAKGKESAGPREGSQTAQVVASPAEERRDAGRIMDKMNWQKHTVRGFMAGAMKKAGYTVESFKPEGGERTAEDRKAINGKGLDWYARVDSNHRPLAPEAHKPPPKLPSVLSCSLVFQQSGESAFAQPTTPTGSDFEVLIRF
jgi:hypothetical protein